MVSTFLYESDRSLPNFLWNTKYELGSIGLPSYPVIKYLKIPMNPSIINVSFIFEVVERSHVIIITYTTMYKTR
jgi:hypothetical protein